MYFIVYYVSLLKIHNVLICIYEYECIQVQCNKNMKVIHASTCICNVCIYIHIHNYNEILYPMFLHEDHPTCEVYSTIIYVDLINLGPLMFMIM